MMVFLEKPISAGFMAICALLILAQVYFALRGAWRKRQTPMDNAPVNAMPVMEE